MSYVPFEGNCLGVHIDYGCRNKRVFIVSDTLGNLFGYLIKAESSKLTVKQKKPRNLGILSLG
ncbi:Uncharacterised protein [Stutzerimonas stutzeri]|nr:Uncharacterised protein [Stutzerimonas stutzeri]